MTIPLILILPFSATVIENVSVITPAKTAIAGLLEKEINEEVSMSENAAFDAQCR